MDPNQPAQNPQQPQNAAQPAQPPVHPMREPHLPISEHEMDPTPPSPTSARRVLFTLCSLLVLAGVVGITLWLYIQNRTETLNSAPIPPNSNPQADSPSASLTEESRRIATLPSQLAARAEKYDGLICKRFESIEEALESAEIACYLDLSNNGLDTLPESIDKLTNLTEVDLSNNDLSEFPQELLNLKSIKKINLSNNNISQLPRDILDQLPELQELDVSNNSISSIQDWSRSLTEQDNSSQEPKLYPLHTLDLSRNNIPAGQIAQIEKLLNLH